jgi:hypothetical protein
MPDVSHYIGSDIAASANGDILLADSLVLSQQNILRRLLTNPGDYIWQPTYGAGLPSKIGQAVDIASVKSIILANMLLENSVARNPAPVINVTPISNGIYVEIIYTEVDSQLPVTLQFNVKQ